MLRGLYIAGSGMTERASSLDALANNVANLQTDTFKRDRVVYSEFHNIMLQHVQGGDIKGNIGKLSMGAVTSTGNYIDFTQGPITNTSNDHDLAIEGDGFIKVEIQPGVTRYTRDAKWQINQQDILVDCKGNPILDDSGSQISIPGKGKLTISPDGEITQDNSKVAKIGLVEIDNKALLQKDGNSMYFIKNDLGDHEVEASNTSLRQGFIERPNFSPLSAITEMISLLREYEASQKVLQTYDDTIDQAVTRLGRAQSG